MGQRKMPFKNAMMMLRSTVVVLSAFAMIISRSLARETQYFYNSVTGEATWTDPKIALDRRGDREEVLANGRRDGDVGIARGLERRVVRGTQNAVLLEQKNVGKHVGSPGRISMGKSEPRS